MESSEKGKTINSYVTASVRQAIQSGIPELWESEYHFFQLAIVEKLRKEGLMV